LETADRAGCRLSYSYLRPGTAKAIRIGAAGTKDCVGALCCLVLFAAPGDEATDLVVLNRFVL